MSMKFSMLGASAYRLTLYQIYVSNLTTLHLLPSSFPVLAYCLQSHPSLCSERRVWLGSNSCGLLSSKPGKEARCFLNGDAIELSVLKSAGDLAVDEDASAVVEGPRTGVPETGDPAISPTGEGEGSMKRFRRVLTFQLVAC